MDCGGGCAGSSSRATHNPLKGLLLDYNCSNTCLNTCVQSMAKLMWKLIKAVIGENKNMLKAVKDKYALDTRDEHKWEGK